MASSTHEVVVLGGNFAGLNIVHHLHRQVLPALQRLNKSVTYHVTLVSPNSHFFFKVAAPRALINDTAIPTEKVFRRIEDGLKQYGDACAFLQGKATQLDASSRVVKVDVVGGTTKDLRYDSLFICTGTTSRSPLWTVHDDHEASVKAMKEMHQRLPKTNTVLIAGAGPVGVETAGEIAAAYPNIKITLVAGGDVLERLKPGVRAKAKKLLADAKVEVLTNVRVNDSSESGSSTTVTLSDGTSRTVDLYIDARGSYKVNSEFLPKSWLDKSGRVLTGDKYFRVKGDGSADVKGIYVVGDIVAGSTNTAIEMDAQLTTAASSFAVDVAKSLGHQTNASGGLLSWIPGMGSKGIAQKEFKPMQGTMVVPVGPNGGAGQIMGWAVPSFMVKKVKAEKFLMEMVEPAVTGSKFAKA
jgi:NADH dehydrogenase FAD-containing subunit